MRAAQTLKERHTPGEAGIWVFILGDMLVFALFFFVFTFYRGENPDIYNDAQDLLNTNYGALNTLLLLTSSWFVVLGVEAVRRDAAAVASRFFLMAITCGLGFSGIKFLEYGEKISAGITLNSNEFFMYYYMFTGIHFLHVLIGICVLSFLYAKSKGSMFSEADIQTFESGASYWHMVDLLWIVLFPLLYLVR